MDAMFTDEALCTQIVEQGGFFVVQLKRNQKTIHEEISTYFNLTYDCWPDALPQVKTVDKGHGRKETRHLRVVYKPFRLGGHDRFKTVKHVAHITKTRYRYRKKKIVERAQQDSYLMTNLPPSPHLAQQLLSYSREHWLVENRLHWQKDVTLREDQQPSRRTQSACNVALLNDIAVFVLETYRSLKGSTQSLARMTHEFTQKAHKCITACKRVFSMLWNATHGHKQYV